MEDPFSKVDVSSHIIAALNSTGKTLPYDNLEQLRMKLFEDHPVFAGIDHAPGAEGAADFDAKAVGQAGDVADEAFTSPVSNFYFTNPIARASETLAACSALRSEPAAATGRGSPGRPRGPRR